jgi:ribosome-associated protein
MVLIINESLSIDESDLYEQFIHASGPGGQNVNKVATAVQLSFNAAGCKALTPEVFTRLRTLAGTRMTNEGVLILTARRFRSQDRNRQDARERLQKLILRALERPKIRKATRPSRAAKRARLDAKKKRSGTKKARRPVDPRTD